MAKNQTPWSRWEIGRFLFLNQKGMTAEAIGQMLQRSKYTVQAMRRKLIRLQKLGASGEELASLLAVNERIVMQKGLAEIRRRAAEPMVPVRSFLRCGRVTGRPHLVEEHKRHPVEAKAV